METVKPTKRGISLIVLVITIIIMIILAATVVVTLSNSGIISKANDAVDITDLATVQDLATMLWAEAYLDKAQDIEDVVITGLSNQGINMKDYVVTVTDSGVTVVRMPEEWKENVTTIVEGVPIPKGFIASPYEGENTKNGGLVIYELTDKDIEDENQYTSWTTRNQYVWIPVAEKDFTIKFVRNLFNVDHMQVCYFPLYLEDTLGTNNDNAMGVWETELLDTNMPQTSLSNESLEFISPETLAEVQAMYASVKKYQGFYIGRYEAGVTGSRTFDSPIVSGTENVHSKMGKMPYNIIPWSASDKMKLDGDGAVEVARSLYTEDNTKYGVVSTLTYGVQWDTVLQWWLDTGAVTSLTNSTTYGNHVNTKIDKGDLNSDAKYGVYNYATGICEYSPVTYNAEGSTLEKADGTRYILTTGALKKAKKNNIYDMAGNMDEWTMEGYSTTGRILRGGFYGGNGSLVSVAGRTHFDFTSYGLDFGFRPSLYIKN